MMNLWKLWRETRAALASQAIHDRYFGARDGSGPLKSLNTRRTCPDCGNSGFHPGPSGGSAINVMCARCRAKFWYGPPFNPQRVDNEDQFYNQDVVKRLEDL